MIYGLLRGAGCPEAVNEALTVVELPEPLRETIQSASGMARDQLPSSGWVRHTLQSAVWGLLTTDTFEEAVVQVANLGGDADSAASVAGAMAGAAYGLEAIPPAWRELLRGSYPIESKKPWNADRLVELADRLVKMRR